MKIIDIEQNTDKWKKWRKGGIGASESSSILGVNPWSSKEDWLHTSLGLRTFKGNKHTQRGHRLEPYVRYLCQRELNMKFRAVCVEHDEYPWIRASLDGLCTDNKHILEIKCPNKNTHYSAIKQKVPKYYYVQIQHQFLVTGLEKAYYASYNPDNQFKRKGEELAIVEVVTNPVYISKLLEELKHAKALRDKAEKLLQA